MDETIHSKQYETVLALLRSTRKHTGVTQFELARRVGETQSFISKCERGERRLDIIELRTFCRALGQPFVGFIKQLERRLGND